MSSHHRAAFLLVDSILEWEPRQRCVGQKKLAINEPFFGGHFPGYKELTDLNINIGEAEKQGNADFFHNVLHDALRFRRANKTIATKTQFLEDLSQPGNSFDELRLSDVKVTPYEDTAVVSLRVHARGNRAETDPWQGIYRNTRIFLKEGDQWKLAFWFNTTIGDLPVK